ncbi:MAG: GspH/FimT family pseudopilin [Mariprofundales bacterium]
MNISMRIAANLELRHHYKQVKQRKQQYGFSLIELMTVIGVLGIIMMIAAPSFTEWRESTAVRSATETMKAQFKYARHIAMAENRQVVITFSDVLPYGYVFDLGGSKEKTMLLEEFSNNLTLSTNRNPLTYQSGGSMKAGTITIASTKSASSKAITVNAIGRVYEQ